MHRTREPTTVIGLLHSIVDSSSRTWHAVCLLLAAAMALAVVLLPALIVALLFGIPGVAAVGAVGSLMTTVAIATRRFRRRATPISTVVGSTPDSADAP